MWKSLITVAGARLAVVLGRQPAPRFVHGRVVQEFAGNADRYQDLVAGSTTAQVRAGLNALAGWDGRIENLVLHVAADAFGIDLRVMGGSRRTVEHERNITGIVDLRTPFRAAGLATALTGTSTLTYVTGHDIVSDAKRAPRFRACDGVFRFPGGVAAGDGKPGDGGSRTGVRMLTARAAFPIEVTPPKADGDPPGDVPGDAVGAAWVEAVRFHRGSAGRQSESGPAGGTEVLPCGPDTGRPLGRTGSAPGV